jgi:hypothetical protein
LNLTVENVAPTVYFHGPDVIHVGHTLHRVGFFEDPGVRDTWRVIVDYGDGGDPEVIAIDDGHTFRLRHDYTEPGTYRVVITIIDDEGGIGTARFDALVQ